MIPASSMRTSAIVNACFRLILDGETSPPVTRWGNALSWGL